MRKTIEVDKGHWEKICLKSCQYGFEPVSALKCMGMKIREMWFPEDMEYGTALNWVEGCRYVQENYARMEASSGNGFFFKIVSEYPEIKIEIGSDILTANTLDYMEEAFRQMAEYLADNSWEQREADFLPVSQGKIRERINGTYMDVRHKCLHARFYENAFLNPGAKALIWFENGIRRTMTYGELRDSSLKAANMLIRLGVKKGDMVSVILPKGVEQVIAVLGIHSAGAAYVPVGIHQPVERKKKILQTGKIKYILTDESQKKSLAQIEDSKAIAIEDRHGYEILESPVLMPVDSTAYVIFTSGTTGTPKGVVISHKSAYNTIYDINRRFEITDRDCAIGVSELDFDLSVYDIFGLLSAGGSLLVPGEDNKKEAAVWHRLITGNGVTVWNTVPALFDMLLTASEPEKAMLPIEKVFLSGDWIKMDLFPRMKKLAPDCRFVSLGGATEASIWSNYYEVNEMDVLWKSIPYGMPLSNQRLRVVNKYGGSCPDFVCGELWIGGMGIASGYLNGEELTREKFVDYEGELWYKTGDMARYNSLGIVEFIGRMDTQVKLNGYRIELGEIENVLKKYEGISDAVVTVVKGNSSGHIVAAVVPDLHRRESRLQKQLIVIERSNCSGNDELKQRLEAVERFLLELYCLEGLDRKPGKKCCEEMEDVLKIWDRWLKEREIFDTVDNKTVQGKRYREVLNSNKTVQCEFGKLLSGHMDLFRKILRGEEDVTALVKYPDLMPETLAMQGEEAEACMDKIAQEIHKEASSRIYPVRVAVLGARTGMAAGKLLERLEEPVEMTLFDASSGMLDAARKRFAGFEGSIGYQTVIEGLIDKKHLYSYDFVVAVNSLHQYLDPTDGILLASMLLKNGGGLMAVEYEELDPMAIVVSAVLEKGFTGFNTGRSRRNNPLLTKEEWMKVFSTVNYNDVCITAFSGWSAEFIHARTEHQRNTSEAAIIGEYLKEHLPGYMIPEKTEALAWLPLSANGKVDRKRIARILSSNIVFETERDDYIGIEEEIAGMWKELLHHEYIGRGQGFFEIGGDSLLATRFLSDIKRIYKIELSLRDVFDSPKLCQVAEIVNNKLEAAAMMVEGEL